MRAWHEQSVCINTNYANDFNGKQNVLAERLITCQAAQKTTNPQPLTLCPVFRHLGHNSSSMQSQVSHKLGSKHLCKSREPCPSVSLGYKTRHWEEIDVKFAKYPNIFRSIIMDID